MKSVLLSSLIALMALNSQVYAQEEAKPEPKVRTKIIGGKDLRGGTADEFELLISRIDKNDEVYVKGRNQDITDDINCIEDGSNPSYIEHYNSSDKSVGNFQFQQYEDCHLVRQCGQQLEEMRKSTLSKTVQEAEDGKIGIYVDRETKEIVEIDLPEFCESDPWASVGAARFKDRL